MYIFKYLLYQLRNILQPGVLLVLHPTFYKRQLNPLKHQVTDPNSNVSSSCMLTFSCSHLPPRCASWPPASGSLCCCPASPSGHRVWGGRGIISNILNQQHRDIINHTTVIISATLGHRRHHHDHHDHHDHHHHHHHHHYISPPHCSLLSWHESLF